MPVCKNNPKRKYKGTEPSPKGLGWCASGEKIGKKRKGKDGNMWIIKKVSNGSKRWMKDSKTKTKTKTETETKNDLYKKIKEETKGYKSYFTHNNGARPYLVYVSKNKKEVKIYKPKNNIKNSNWSSNDKKNKWMYVKLVGKYKPTRIFIGKDNGTSEMSDLKRMSKKESIKFSLGNSILLELKDRYLFIGHIIYSFKTESKDNIEKYYSVIGRNDVPYPVGYSNKNVYFMLDKTYIPYTKIPVLEDKKDPDAYYYYYGFANDNIKYDKFAKKMKHSKTKTESKTKSKTKLNKNQLQTLSILKNDIKKKLSKIWCQNIYFHK